jgi:transporter family-2 protein
VALLSAVSFSIPRIGVSATLGFVLAAQLVVAAWLDHHGYLGAEVHLFDRERMAGMVLLIAGAWLVLR